MMDKCWTQELFGTCKPIIAMCHLMALPGDPGYDRVSGMALVVERARQDLCALQDGGVDGVMFSNEFSLPYLTRVETVTVASMAHVIGVLLKDIQVPFGVNVLWDPKASLDLATATGASFVREIFTGVYASDFGLWNTNCGETIRHQHHIGAEKVRLLFNIVPEAAQYLADREIAAIAKSTVFNNRPDALCVSGLIAGVKADTSTLKAVKQAVPGTVVFANTGVRVDNIDEQLSIADGAIVGTAFKQEGVFTNPVDGQRVQAFMNKVKEFRRKID
jgi:membrane complex biogenesis BtpA family protein